MDENNQQPQGDQSLPFPQDPPVQQNPNPYSDYSGTPSVSPLMPTAAPVLQPTLVASQPPNIGEDNEKYAKRLKVVGTILVVLGALLAAGNLFFLNETQNQVALAFSAAQVLIGIGLIQHRKTAYRVFNIIAMLNITFGTILMFFLPFQFIAAQILIIYDPVMGVILWISSALLVLQYIFYIVAGILLHPKPLRAILK